MSIFDRFRRPRPTAHWVADARVDLVADLDRFALNDVGFGDPISRLSFLGPSPTDFHAFPALGINLEVTDGNLDGIVVALAKGAFMSGCKPDDVQPFVGTLRMAGRVWHPRELMHERQFVEVLGEPYWRAEDRDEVLLFFELAHGELQIEFSLDDWVQAVVVSPAPLMADPEQRQMYGVTKPWPPT